MENLLIQIKFDAKENQAPSLIIKILSETPGLSEEEIWKRLPDSYKRENSVASIRSSLKRIKYFALKNGKYYLTTVDDLLQAANELTQEYGIKKVIDLKASLKDVEDLINSLKRFARTINESQIKKMKTILEIG